MNQWLLMLVPLSSVGSVANRPSPNWQEIHTTYIPLIVLAEPGGVKNATDPTFWGNQKQPLNEVMEVLASLSESRDYLEDHPRRCK